MPNNPEEKWREEFDKVWSLYFGDCACNRNQIESFIAKLLKERLEEQRRVIFCNGLCCREDYLNLLLADQRKEFEKLLQGGDSRN